MSTRELVVRLLIALLLVALFITAVVMVVNAGEDFSMYLPYIDQEVGWPTPTPPLPTDPTPTPPLPEG